MARRRKEGESFGDYCVVPGADRERNLSDLERLSLLGAQRLEQALRFFVGGLEPEEVCQRLGDLDIEAVKEAAMFYGTAGWLESPASFYQLGAAPTGVAETAIHGFSDGEIVDLEFESAYRPYHPDYQATLRELGGSNPVQVRLWRHHQPSELTVVAVHGWAMGDPRLNSLAFLPGLYYRAGLDVALYELPLHGRRVDRGGAQDSEWMSFFPSSDLMLTNEAIGQSIYELSALRAYLGSNGIGQVGAIGVSLGGYLAALWASLEKIRFCVPVVPLVSMPDFVWRVLGAHRDFPRWRSAGLSLQLLREAFGVHSPLREPLCLPSSDVMIIAGSDDTLIPQRQVEALWEHWGQPEIVWLTGGHARALGGTEVINHVFEFLERLGLGRRPEAEV